MTTLDLLQPTAKKYRRLAECGIVPIRPSFQTMREWIDAESDYAYELHALNDATYAMLAEIHRLHLRDLDPWADVAAGFVALIGIAALLVAVAAIF